MDLDARDHEIVVEALERNFTTEELERAELLDRPFDQALRRQLADLDFMFFCQFYLRDHFYLPPAPIHYGLADRIEAVLRTPGPTYDAIAWPRGHAKTTMVSLGLPLYCVTPAVPRVRYTLPVADSLEQAKAYLMAIKDELEHNPRVHEDYGRLRGATWQSTQIVTTNRACIDALGRGMKIRGRKFLQWRPGLIILDDIEEITRTESPVNREADSKWLARSVMKAGAPDCKLLVLGTVIHYDSVLARVLKDPMFRTRRYQAVTGWSRRPDLWKQWEDIVTNLANEKRHENALAFFDAHEEEMLEGTSVAWEDRYSYYELMLLRVTGEGLTEGSSFEAEMQNEPVDPTLRYFSHFGRYRSEWRAGKPGEEGEVWLVPLSGRPAVPLSACEVFMGVDPSLAKERGKARQDPSATVVLAKAPFGVMFVLECIIDWLTPDEIINNMVEFGRRYVLTDVPVEAQQFQYLFATDAARASASAGVYLPVSPVTQTANKMLRIRTMQPDLQNEYILFPEFGAEALVDQLKAFPLAEHDDGPDALEMVRRIAKSWVVGAHTTTVEAESHEFGHELDEMQAGVQDPWAKYDELADVELAYAAERLREEARLKRVKEQEEREAPPGAYPWYPTMH